MADFCNQCAEKRGLPTGDYSFDNPEHGFASVLCEGCGPTVVDCNGDQIVPRAKAYEGALSFYAANGNWERDERKDMFTSIDAVDAGGQHFHGGARARAVLDRYEGLKLLSEKVPGVCLAADALLVDELGDVLLVKKKSSGLWGLPGGFVEIDDPSIEAAASRELKEETGLYVPPCVLSLAGLFNFPDPRLMPFERLYVAVCKAVVSRGVRASGLGALRIGGDNGNIEQVAWVDRTELDFALVGGERMFLPHLDVLRRLGLADMQP